jgi:type IV secretory pathway TraG/TraD family ATPase VirD4
MALWRCTFEGTPAQTGSVTIGITVTDANDNAPVIVFDPSWPLVVRAATQTGETVMCFNATDPDELQNPVFTFSYVCNSASCRDFTLTTNG